MQFGIDDGVVPGFLAERGFSNVKIVTGEDYKKACYSGVNKDRAVSNLLSFAYASVE